MMRLVTSQIWSIQTEVVVRILSRPDRPKASVLSTCRAVPCRAVQLQISLLSLACDMMRYTWTTAVRLLLHAGGRDRLTPSLGFNEFHFLWVTGYLLVLAMNCFIKKETGSLFLVSIIIVPSKHLLKRCLEVYTAIFQVGKRRGGGSKKRNKRGRAATARYKKKYDGEKGKKERKTWWKPYSGRSYTKSKWR